MILARVEARHFVAGLIIEDGVVTKAAPILEWSVGKKQEWLRAYFKRKGWTAKIIVRR